MVITFILGGLVYTMMTCDAETPIILYLYVYNTMSLSDCGLNIILNIEITVQLIHYNQ